MDGAQQDLLNAAEAAAYLRVKPNTLAIWRSARRYDLPFVKLGRVVRYRKEDLRRFIDNHLQTRSPGDGDLSRN